MNIKLRVLNHNGKILVWNDRDGSKILENHLDGAWVSPNNEENRVYTSDSYRLVDFTDGPLSPVQQAAMALGMAILEEEKLSAKAIKLSSEVDQANESADKAYDDCEEKLHKLLVTAGLVIPDEEEE